MTYAAQQTASAAAALALNNTALRLEEGNGPGTDLYHLLGALVTWADAQTPRVDFDSILAQVRADNGEADPKTAAVKITDDLRNVAFIRHTAGRGWACTLGNGTPASFFYAGISSGEETETRIALERAKSPAEVLRIVRARIGRRHTAELI